MTAKTNDILGPDGQVEGRVCVDCGEAKKIEDFQRTPKAGNRSSDCKACRRKKFEAGMEARGKVSAKPATKDWVIEQATILFNRAQKDTDKAKYLDLISRNLNSDDRDITDDAKVVQSLKESMAKMKELRG